MRRYQKDFEGWTQLKSRLQRRSKPRTFNEREIWWIALGQNIGDEEDGKGTHFSRPVVVVRKFNQHLFWGVPTTSKPRHGKYYLSFQYGSSQTDIALLSQLRIFDSKRLLNKQGVVDNTVFATMQLKLILLLKDQPYK